MSVTLIDPDGRKVNAGWRLDELRELSGLPDESLFEYLCRNMGYILIRSRDPQSLALRLNPAIVSAPGLAAAFYITAENADATVKVELLGRGAPQSHVLDGVESAIDFVSQVVKVRSISESDRFFRQRAPLGEEMEHRQFRHLLEVLGRFKTPETSEFVKAHLRRHFHGRFVILKGNPEAGRLLLSDAGQGYTGLSNSGQANYWANEAVGKPVDKLFDQAYWSFVSDAFKETAQTGRPTLDDVDAIVLTSPGQSTALSYLRLIVPLSQRSLLGVSVRRREPIVLSS